MAMSRGIVEYSREYSRHRSPQRQQAGPLLGQSAARVVENSVHRGDRLLGAAHVTADDANIIHGSGQIFNIANAQFGRSTIV